MGSRGRMLAKELLVTTVLFTGFSQIRLSYGLPAPLDHLNLHLHLEDLDDDGTGAGAAGHDYGNAGSASKGGAGNDYGSADSGFPAGRLNDSSGKVLYEGLPDFDYSGKSKGRNG